MGGREMSVLPPAWLLVGALAVGWFGGGLSAWMFLRTRRREAAAIQGSVAAEPRSDEFVTEPPARRLAAPSLPAPAPERRLLDLSDQEIDALAAELPPAEAAQRRKLPAPRKPVLRNI